MVQEATRSFSQNSELLCSTTGSTSISESVTVSPKDNLERKRPVFARLNSRDYLRFKEAQLELEDEPQVYATLLNAIKDSRLDDSRVMERVSEPLKGYPELIEGFDFLPWGSCIQVDSRVESSVCPRNPNIAAWSMVSLALDSTSGSSGGHEHDDNPDISEEIQRYFVALVSLVPVWQYPNVYYEFKDILDRTIDDRLDDLGAIRYVSDLFELLQAHPVLVDYTKSFLPPHTGDHVRLKARARTLLALIDSILFC